MADGDFMSASGLAEFIVDDVFQEFLQRAQRGNSTAHLRASTPSTSVAPAPALGRRVFPTLSSLEPSAPRNAPPASTPAPQHAVAKKPQPSTAPSATGSAEGRGHSKQGIASKGDGHRASTEGNAQVPSKEEASSTHQVKPLKPQAAPSGSTGGRKERTERPQDAQSHAIAMASLPPPTADVSGYMSPPSAGVASPRMRRSPRYTDEGIAEPDKEPRIGDEYQVSRVPKCRGDDEWILIKDTAIPPETLSLFNRTPEESACIRALRLGLRIGKKAGKVKPPDLVRHLGWGPTFAGRMHYYLKHRRRMVPREAVPCAECRSTAPAANRCCHPRCGKFVCHMCLTRALVEHNLYMSYTLCKQCRKRIGDESMQVKRGTYPSESTCARLKPVYEWNRKRIWGWVRHEMDLGFEEGGVFHPHSQGNAESRPGGEAGNKRALHDSAEDASGKRQKVEGGNQ